MKNLKIYNNVCKEEVLNKVQLSRIHSEYSIGKTLFATSDRGKRAYQEDSVIVLEHPNASNIKLIAVADGVGSCIDSELASNHVLKRLIEWFEETTEEDHNNPLQTKKDLDIMLKTVLKGLQANIYSATTLSAAIVLKEKTIITNIGDSRIYIVKNDHLKQPIKDDSEVEKLYRNRGIMNREIMRFHKYNGIITTAIAYWPQDYKMNYRVINNKNYDKILVVTDGVSDCLSTEEIKNIIKTSKAEEITNNIVAAALNNNSNIEDIIKTLSPKEQQEYIELHEIFEEDYWKTIEGGKDNTTAAVYIRK
ncbi:MAG: serine/threonine-protein phosphatase [Bacilli bacterium]|nr:serine/threonine-protein phosphatase [Bacilli bacterium]